MADHNLSRNGQEKVREVCLQLGELTPEAAPASHVAGGIVRQDFSGRGKTGGLDGIGEHHRGRQLDQGDVVTGT